jgi:hypothetical protein
MALLKMIPRLRRICIGGASVRERPTQYTYRNSASSSAYRRRIDVYADEMQRCRLGSFHPHIIWAQLVLIRSVFSQFHASTVISYQICTGVPDLVQRTKRHCVLA